MDNTACLLACNRIPHLGPRSLARCRSLWPDLNDLFRASLQELQAAGLSESVSLAIKQFDFSILDADLAWLTKPNHHVLIFGSAQYPKWLAEIPSPPIILYAKGDLDCLNQTLLGIVGTRHPSIAGANTAWRFAHDLAQVGLTIVSGLALGIDSQAHSGCLAAQGKTVAVLGTGIDIVYPRRNHVLAGQIAEAGLLISEFPLGSLPIANHFPRRNRIISGLSSALLVIEAAVRSGSLITAKFAMEQNRDVFAIPGSIYHSQASGCLRLLQQGACLVTSPQEVYDEMHLGGAQFTKNISIFPKICDNTQFLQHVGFEVTTVDQLVERSACPISEVLCKIVELELQGLIQMVPGGYMRCR